MHLRSRRAAGLLAAALASGAALSACGAQPATTPAAATRALTAAPAADTGGGLSAGLLPAEAFGSGATVTPLPADRLRQAGAMAGGMAGMLPAGTLTPAGCASALQDVLPLLAGVDDAAGEVARAGGTVTAELLAVPGSPVDAVARFTAVTQACAGAQVTSPHGSGTVSIAPLAVPALGDGAAAVALTVSGQGPDGTARTGTALVGLVQDGQRVLAVAQASPQGDPLDPATFSSLLQQADAALD
jgi:hypothetical protein